MPMKVRSTEVGIEMAVTSVERIDRRKTRITMTAKKRPRRPSVASDSIDFSMNGAWSNTIVNSVPLPIDSASAGSAPCTARETSTVLPAGVLVTPRVRASSPFTRE